MKMKQIEGLLKQYGFYYEPTDDAHRKYYNPRIDTCFYFLSEQDTDKRFRFSGIVNYGRRNNLLNNDLRGVTNLTLLYYALIGFIQTTVLKQ